MTTTSPPPVTPPPADPLSLKPRHEQLVSDPLIEILSIHRAMRLEMQAVCDAVHGAKNDTKQLSDAARRFERYAVVFRAHSSAEDDLLLPALELREAQTRGIETTPEHDAAHDVETQKLEAAEQAFTKLLAAKPNSADFKRKLASLKLELDGFREFMADHMLEEEEEMLPRLRRAFAHDELLQLTGAVLGRRGADDTVATLEVVVPNLEPLQARHVLATMSAVGGGKFRAWLASLASVSGAQKGGSARGACSSSGGPCAYCVAKRPPPPPKKRGKRKRRKKDDDGDSTISSNDETGDVKIEGPSYHCPYCDACKPGQGLGIDAFHCMKCHQCIRAPKGRACSRDPPFVHVCPADANPAPYEVSPKTVGDEPARKVSEACARCGRCVFASLELLDALPCGHVVHARCLQGNTACRQCGAGAAPAPAAGANPLDFLATVITAAKPSSSSK